MCGHFSIEYSFNLMQQRFYCQRLSSFDVRFIDVHALNIECRRYVRDVIVMRNERALTLFHTWVRWEARKACAYDK